MFNFVKKIEFGGDKKIWWVIFALSLVSIIVIYSSVSAIAYAKHTSTLIYLFKQILFILVGWGAMFCVHRMPSRFFKRYSLLLLIASIGLLLWMILFGVNLNDGQRWMRFFGFTFQPADIAKISIVIYLASVLEDNDFDNFKDVLKKIGLPIGIVCFLIFIGNISTSLMLGFICISILYIGGLKLKHIAKICGIAIAAGLILIVMGLTLKWPPRVATAVSRISTYANVGEHKDDKSNKKLDKNYQSEQAKIAVASGGILGKGPGNSTQRYFLPHPYSDFIYAMIIEEYGLAAGIIILLLYMILLYRAAIIAKKCTRIFSSVTVLGLMLMIVFQAMVNMGVSVGVFPVTGQPLPFVSMGGSSMLFTGIAFGIILSVSRIADKQEAEDALEENDNETEIDTDLETTPNIDNEDGQQ